MRSRVLARRILLAPVIGLAFITAACSSSSTTTSSTSSSPPSSSPASTAATPATSASSGSAGSSSTSATGQIKTNWEEFFNGKTSVANRVALLQNGQTFAAVLKAQSGTSLTSSATATVTAVVIESATTATVSYSVGISGASLNNQTGTAVLQDGVWKVGDISFCQLLTLENAGTPISICKSAG
jgi:hypothetical protein